MPGEVGALYACPSSIAEVFSSVLVVARVSEEHLDDEGNRGSPTELNDGVGDVLAARVRRDAQDGRGGAVRLEVLPGLRVKGGGRRVDGDGHPFWTEPSKRAHREGDAVELVAVAVLDVAPRVDHFKTAVVIAHPGTLGRFERLVIGGRMKVRRGPSKRFVARGARGVCRSGFLEGVRL